MGWLYSRSWNRQSLVHHLVTEEQTETRKTLAHSLRGNHLWIAQEYQRPEGEKVRFIALFLLRGGGRDGWGYKGIQESMGPCEVDCPLSFFKLVPEPDGEYAAAWRERVKAYHATMRETNARIRAVRVGDELHLPDGCTPRVLKITAVKPYKGEANGVVYRIRPRFLKEGRIVSAVR